jgi:hypothetical protein
MSTPGAPFGVDSLDVFDPDIEEAADPVRIAWRLQDDRRLVVGRASAGIDDDPAVGQRNIGQPSGAGLGQPAAEYFGVEAPRALDIVRDDEVGQHNILWRRWELGHLVPPLVGFHTPLTTGLQPTLWSATVWGQHLGMGAVRVPPGARTVSHSHALGQALHVAEGLGVVQARALGQPDPRV